MAIVGAAVEGVRWSRFTDMLYRTNRASPDTVSPVSLMLKQMREASAAAAAAAAASSHSGHCVGVQLMADFNYKTDKFAYL